MKRMSTYSPSFTELFVSDGPEDPGLPDLFLDLDVLGPVAAWAVWPAHNAASPIKAKVCLNVRSWL